MAEEEAEAVDEGDLDEQESEAEQQEVEGDLESVRRFRRSFPPSQPGERQQDQQDGGRHGLGQRQQDDEIAGINQHESRAN